MHEGNATAKGLAGGAGDDEPRGRVVVRPLREDDIPAAMALKDAAGWNQTPADWRRFLALAPAGCFAIDEDGELVATSTAVSYGAFGWVGMVLVHPDRRRRGHGTRALLEAVDFLERRGAVPALDATPAGREVYVGHGFAELGALERRVGEAPRGTRQRGRRGGVGDARADDLDAITDLDREAFGGDRIALLRSLRDAAPRLALLHRSRGEPNGFLLGRRGSRFTHLGPCVARDPEVALALLENALERLAGGLVGIDVFSACGPVVERLAAVGLDVERPFIRMARRDARRGAREDAGGATPPGGGPERVFAIAGPEWG